MSNLVLLLLNLFNSYKLGNDFKTKRFQRNTDRKFMIENIQTFMKDVEKVQMSKNEQLSMKIKSAIKRQNEISK